MTETIYMRQGQSQRVQLERRAVAALYPGHLIELTSANKFQKHSVSGGSVCPIIFAYQNDLEGDGIDTAFAADDLIVGIIPQRGDFIQAVLADGQDISIGDKLESAGDGTLQKHTADSADSDDAFTGYAEQVVGIAMEAKDLSDSSGAETEDSALGFDQRIWIMVI